MMDLKAYGSLTSCLGSIELALDICGIAYEALELELYGIHH